MMKRRPLGRLFFMVLYLYWNSSQPMTPDAWLSLVKQQRAIAVIRAPDLNQGIAMARAVARLKAVMEEEGINQALLGGRQHFLRWQTPTTARLWQENGLSYDSTLSYADRPGFRCGTCREYPLFDVHNRSPLQLHERPLILMECSVIASRYLGMGYLDKALDYMLYYKRTCQKFNGHFVLLWHNSHLTHQKDKSFFESLIGTSA